MPFEEHKALEKRGIALKRALLTLLPLLFAFVAAYLAILFASTSPIQEGEFVTFEIERGMTVQEISHEAKEENVVRSSLLLYMLLTYLYDPTAIYAGTYSFDKQLTVFEVAHKLASKDIDNTLIRITIPEGVTRKEIARIASENIEGFDETSFLEKTKNNEGYLFPDTYFISPDFSAEEFVTLLTTTFSRKLAVYKQAIEDSLFTEYEVLILASLLEREANDEESMRTVSGILQNRLQIGMALQTDASVEYILDKPLSELTPDDLKIDTPYNTYLYPGLPPTPIGNPGIQSIEAVLDPKPSEYLFYITGDDGVFYYAETFDEHRMNIANHLR